MIRGIGLDIVAEDEVAGWLDWSEERWEKTLAPCERKERIERGWKARHLAARIAAKEALFKATGLSFRPWEVGVVREDGAPGFWLSERMGNALEGYVLHLSLTHAGGVAAAVVVVEE
ncbi:4'-phosphopantetheinyl transferase superfamily protein [bacterium]|nr:4'-phosphopantetheinyl transferase superfamily protein [bacterium]